MTRRQKYELIFAPETVEHLRAIERKYYTLIQETLDEKLMFDPEVETRNRKLLVMPSPFDATWEIRFGPDNRFRVFYEVDRAGKAMHILAIGLKKGSRLIVGKEEVEL